MKNLVLLFCFFGLGQLAANGQFVHAEDAAHYQHLNFKTDAEYDQAFGRKPKPLPTQNNRRADKAPLGKKVFGWHPSWLGTNYRAYDYSNLHTIAYFSYEVNPATGGYKTIHSWLTTDLVTIAQQAGTKVVLTVTNFDNANNATLLNSPAAKANLINQLITLVKARNANGVNIDFEGVAVAQRDSLTKFMNQLGARFHTEIPGSRVSIALPAIQWIEVFMVAQMTQVDDFLIMGYGYYYGGADKAGPNAPLKPSSWAFWGPTLNLTYSVNWYLNKGVPTEKLFLGLPYYGRRWATASATVPSATQNANAPSASRTYAAAKAELAANNYTRHWNPEGDTPYYVYQQNGQWFQTFYDDAQSLGLKYDLVNQKNLAGIGIWALGYDDTSTNPELNNLLRVKFPPVVMSATDALEDEKPSLYPNPVKRGQPVFLGKAVGGKVILTDALGRSLTMPTVNADGHFSTETFPAGLYFLTASTSQKSVSFRLVVVE
ncbi:glycosyl hydrolase family 18 protein [Rufibacter sp. LB8]|uniref:glycosyl hydrolase family 18 protein n=1 Tax=Rufibacter sp. LB8 TaxID=2777781 RepID=UPI00178C713A|nr:glycosyl hydrolase family 18 protein [Rufibacter sp. LB8]